VKRLLLCAGLLLLFASQAVAAERVLALSPAACEMLFAIGAGKDVVGVADYCDYPVAARHLPHIADARRIFVEPALRLKPTLIVTADRHLEGLRALENRGFRIVVTHPHQFSDIFADLRRLGMLTGHGGQAKRVAAVLERRLQAVRSQHARRIPVFFEVWSDPLMTQGGKSFITEVIDAAGGRNVFASTRMETMRVSIESVIRAQPAVIIVPSRSGDARARRIFWHQWLKGSRVIVINPDLVSRPGPRLVDGVVALHRKLESEKRGQFTFFPGGAGDRKK